MRTPSRDVAVDEHQHGAAVWLARLERGMRVDEGAQLKAWVADPRNRDAILEAAGLWHSKDVQSLLFALTGISPQQRRAVLRTRTVLFPLVVALISTGALIWMATGKGPPRPQPVSAAAERAIPAVPTTLYSTAIGETHEITLADGTRVTLNTNTAVRVRFSQRAREVTLERGEATFDVAHAANAPPFRVIAGSRTFEALGTRFNVRTLRENVDLVVIEGQVKILDAHRKEPTTPARRRDVITYGEQTISAFEEALVDPGFQSVSPIDAKEIQVRLAWQQGLIILDDKALEDALAEIERYTSTKFVVADQSLSVLRVSGSFRTGNVNAVRLALRQNFLVASRRDTRGHIVLSPVHST